MGLVYLPTSLPLESTKERYLTFGRGCSSHDIENIPTTNRKLPTTRKTFPRLRNGSSHVIGTTIKLWSLATRLPGPETVKKGHRSCLPVLPVIYTFNLVTCNLWVGPWRPFFGPAGARNGQKGSPQLPARIPYFGGSYGGPLQDRKITQPYSEVTIMNSFDKAGYLLGGGRSNLKSPTFTGRWHCGTALVSSGPKTQQSHHNHGGGGGDGGDGA